MNLEPHPPAYSPVDQRSKTPIASPSILRQHQDLQKERTAPLDTLTLKSPTEQALADDEAELEIDMQVKKVRVSDVDDNYDLREKLERLVTARNVKALERRRLELRVRRINFEMEKLDADGE